MIDWKTFKLGDLVDLKQGLAINKGTNHLLCDEKFENRIPLFKIRDLLNNTIEHYVKGDEVPKQCVAKPEDLIYSRTGQVGYVFTGKTGCIHNNCFKVIPGEKIDRAFLYQFLSNPVIRQFANDIASGSVQKDLNHTAFKSIEIQVPDSLPEQRSIASILSALDDKIELNLAMNRTLEEMAMALYKHWFVDSGYDQFSKYPLSEILKFVVDNRGKTAPTASEGIPLIATNCVKNESIFPSYDKVRYVDNDTYENWFRAHPKPGDILFVNKGTPGCVNLVPSPVDFCIAQDMIALRADESKVSNLYLFLYFRSKEVQFEIVNKSVGTTIPHLKKTDLLTFEVSIPEFEKMSALTQKVKHMFSQIETNVKENQTLTALRDTLLPKLISGEVRVKDAEQMVNEVL
jgi:type I restriction enzyme S subunit